MALREVEPQFALHEWAEPHAVAAEKSREVARLERQVASTTPAKPKDEVLALIDAPRKAG